MGSGRFWFEFLCIVWTLDGIRLSGSAADNPEGDRGPLNFPKSERDMFNFRVSGDRLQHEFSGLRRHYFDVRVHPSESVEAAIKPPTIFAIAPPAAPSPPQRPRGHRRKIDETAAETELARLLTTGMRMTPASRLAGKLMTGTSSIESKARRLRDNHKARTKAQSSQSSQKNFQSSQSSQTPKTPKKP